MKKNAFFWYWVFALFIITYINYPSALLPRDYKNFGYLFMGLGSLIFFGLEIPKKYLFFYSPIILLAFINQHHLWAKSPFIECLFFAVGFCNLFQFYQLMDRDKFYKMVGIMCLIQCAWIWVNWLGYDPHTVITGQKMVEIKTGSTNFIQPVIGSLGHWMVSGTFLLLSTPFLFSFHPILLLIPIITSVVLPSAIFPVGLALFLVVFCYIKLPIKYKKVVNILACLSPLILLMRIELPEILYPGERFKLWRVSIINLKFNWVWGSGLGYFKDFFHPIFGNKFFESHAHPHNEFIKIFISFGIIGLGVTLNLYRILLRGFKLDPIAGASLLVSIVPMMVGFPLHTASTWLVMAISIASMLKQLDNGLTGEKI